MFEAIIRSVYDLPSVAAGFLRFFPCDRVFAFYGEMGVGKTTLIKALCRQMGTQDTVTSPSFALMNEYEVKGTGNICHFDFYRIRGAEEAMDIGLNEYLYSGNYCLIEWPEKVESLLPAGRVEVHMEEISPTMRLLSAHSKETI